MIKQKKVDIPMNSVIDQSKKHIIQHVLFYGIGLFVVLYFYETAHFPYLGFDTNWWAGEGELKVTVVDPGSPADRAGLAVNDRILRIGDHETFIFRDLFLILHKISDRVGLPKTDRILKIVDHDIFSFIDLALMWHTIKANQTYPIIYKREGTILSGDLIPDQPFFSYNSMGWIILGMLYLGLGMMVYLNMSSEPHAKIFYILMVCVFASLVAIFRDRLVINIGLVISYFAGLLVAPLFMHLLLIFPERKKIVIEHPWIPAIVYLPSLGAFSATVYLCLRTVLFYYMGQNDPSIFHDMELILQGYIALLIVYLGIGIVCLVHTYVTTLSPETKKQIKWLLWGYSVTAIFIFWGLYALSKDLRLFLYGNQILPVPMVIGLIIPFFTTLLSIFKYRLMDIDIVIHRSLAYSVVSGIVVLLYFLLFSFLGWVFKLFIAGSSPFLTMMISALMIAIIFRPLLIQFEQWIDQLLFKEKYALQKAIEDISELFVTVQDSKTISEKVFQIVGTTLNVQTGGFWLQEADGRTLTPCYSFPQEKQFSLLSIDLFHPLAVLLIEARMGLTHYQLLTEPEFHDYQDEYLKPYEKTGMQIFLPLIFNDTLLGLMGFGEKGSRDLYATEEVRLLTALARQTAVALENAHKYTQTNSLNKALKEKITQIEQQQDEILTLQKQLLNENIVLREEIQQHFNFDEIIGDSPAMKEVLSMVEKVAPTPSTVLIRGESGTGKELISRAIHFNSPRRDAPFVKVNCAAIPENLLESELFGHERGAFTGAVTSKIGKFELAAKGSIFLDEIGDLKPDLQTKLLRVLQEKSFERVGGNTTIQADTRIIAATNRDIEKAITDGNFREDLYYRLNVISILLPPLRDRKEDIMALAIHFIRKFCSETGKSIQNIDTKAMETLKMYDWPGNVRELANVIERAVVLGEDDTLSIKDFPKSLVPSAVPSLSPNMIGDLSNEVAQLEQKRINEAMEKTKGNISEAARVLNLKRSTLGSKLKKYNIK